MARYDLAGNPIPEPGGPPPQPPGAGGPAPFVETRLPSSLPPVPAPRAVVSSPSPTLPIGTVASPIPAPYTPAAPLSAQSILTRGVTQETPAQKLRAYAGLLATFVVLIIATYVVAAIPTPHVPAPTSYTPVSSTMINVTCDAPVDWTQHIGTRTGMITLTQKSAMIHIDGAPADAGDSTNPAPSVDDLHAQYKDQTSEILGDLPVVELATQSLTIPMGEARVTEWTAREELTQLHGYRVTLLGSGMVSLVLCKCNERDWAALKPAFLHVIKSIQPAAAPGSPGQTGGQ